MCAVGGSLLLLGSLGSAIQVSLAPRSWPAPSRTPLRAGDSQSGGRGSGKRSRVLEVTSRWERWARVQASCCQGPVSTTPFLPGAVSSPSESRAPLGRSWRPRLQQSLLSSETSAGCWCRPPRT